MLSGIPGIVLGRQDVVAVAEGHSNSMGESGMAWAEGEEAMAAMAPEGGLFARLDPVSLGSSLLAVGRRTWQNPVETANAWWRLGLSLARIAPEAAGPWSGREPASREASGAAGQKLAADRRFADPAWQDNPAFFALGLAYLAAVQFTDELLAAGRGDAATDAKARLAADLMLAGLAPTNYFLSNPIADAPGSYIHG